VRFEGLSPNALRFLEELGKNNEREWFHAHRDEYDRELLEPARDLVEAMGEELDRRGLEVHADPRVGGSIFRIARDTRFSKDKRPYKTHLALWFWQGSGPSRECPGFWFRLTPNELILGAGMHRFDRPLLERYREAVADERRGRALADAVAAIEAQGCHVGGEKYKRVPAGYDADHERAALLRHDGLYAWLQLDLPKELYSAAFPAFCAERYARMRPVQDWLLELVAAA
jgi:uncharacterized protein (TIGR02453 family)